MGRRGSGRVSCHVRVPLIVITRRPRRCSVEPFGVLQAGGRKRGFARLFKGGGFGSEVVPLLPQEGPSRPGRGRVGPYLVVTALHAIQPAASNHCIQPRGGHTPARFPGLWGPCNTTRTRLLSNYRDVDVERSTVYTHELTRDTTVFTIGAWKVHSLLLPYHAVCTST